MQESRYKNKSTLSSNFSKGISISFPEPWQKQRAKSKEEKINKNKLKM
jgi:tRNA G46 methylase TrmB